MVPSRFSEIEAPANPGEFNYRRYMANKSVWHRAFLKTSEVVRLGEKTGNVFYGAVKLRKKVIKKLDQHIKDREAAAVISTLLLGYKADLNREILNTYSATGVMHVLSVSGMHVAIVAALAGYLLGIWKGRKMNIAQALFIVMFVWLYTLLSGLSAAACRSAVMMSFMITGRLLNRNAGIFNCVSAAAFFQLLSKPLWLFDLGFQLSYIAVFGLILFYPVINAMLKFRSAINRAIWSYLAFSLAAQVATFPLCLYYFNQFPLYFLASNVFIMVPVTVVMYAGVGFLMMSFLPYSADMPLRCLAWLMENGIISLNAGLRFIAKLPSSSLHGYHLHITFYLLIYLLIGFLFVGITKKSKKAVWYMLILSVLISSIYTISGLIIWRRKSVVFYSIRNHVAVAFTRAGRATILTDIDVGNNTLSYSVMPLIRDRNLRLSQVAHFDSLIAEPDLKVSGGSVRFRNLELEIIDGGRLSQLMRQSTNIIPQRWYRVGNKLPRKRIVMLHDDPLIELPSLLKTHNISYVVIGIKNSKQNTDRWLYQSDSMGIPSYSLKRLGALELDIQDL
jgi:competence protein ComEC